MHWKYSRPGSHTHKNFGARRSGPDILLSVQNDGSEIPESERERIFDKFYRGSKDRSRVEGTGLRPGDCQNDRRVLSGENLARCGAAGPRHFVLRFPLEATGEKRVITNRTILLIDDEPQIRRVLRTSLTAQQANVLDVQSGEEALELLREHTVDLIILDINMPGMGGLETCRAIRSGWDVPIIIESVRESDRDKVTEGSRRWRGTTSYPSRSASMN